MFPKAHDDSNLRTAGGRVDAELDALVADFIYIGDRTPLLADDVDSRDSLKAQLGDRLRFGLTKPYLPGIRSKLLYFVLGASGYGIPYISIAAVYESLALATTVRNDCR